MFLNIQSYRLNMREKYMYVTNYVPDRKENLMIIIQP